MLMKNEDAGMRLFVAYNRAVKSSILAIQSHGAMMGSVSLSHLTPHRPPDMS